MKLMTNQHMFDEKLRLTEMEWDMAKKELMSSQSMFEK